MEVVHQGGTGQHTRRVNARVVLVSAARDLGRTLGVRVPIRGRVLGATQSKQSPCITAIGTSTGWVEPICRSPKARRRDRATIRRSCDCDAR
nr:putative integron gene cassette protein [uncultured bacterium]